MESQYLLERRARMLGKKSTEEKPKLKPIKRVSDKRRVEQRKYKKIVKEILGTGAECKIKSPVCTGRAQGLNHKQKRSPSNFLLKENLEEACNACNLYVEEHPVWAQKHGHQISRFKKQL